MLTDSEPCETAAGLTRTLLLITTVPVRELMITLAAALAGSTSRFSTVERNATRCVMSRGARTRTDPPSMMRRHAVADALVDARHQARRGREVGVVEVQDDGIALRELRRHGPLDRRAVRDAPRARHVDRELRAVVALRRRSR